MYCKKCGNVVPDDSMFCKYCGEQLSDVKSERKQVRKSLINRFQSLSKGWQICLMSYVCWVFLWIILCVTEAIDEYDQGACILTFVFALPIMALFVWYYLTRLKNKNKEKKKSGSEQIKAVLETSTSNIDQGYSIYPLLEFAKSYGKMQVKTETDGNGNTSSHCIFTNTDGIITKVEFGETTAGMTATEISANKEKLFVVRNPEMNYQLVRL